MHGPAGEQVEATLSALFVCETQPSLRNVLKHNALLRRTCKNCELKYNLLRGRDIRSQWPLLSASFSPADQMEILPFAANAIRDSLTGRLTSSDLLMSKSRIFDQASAGLFAWNLGGT